MASYFKTVRIPRSVEDKVKKLNATHTPNQSFTLKKISHNVLTCFCHCDGAKDSLVTLSASLKAPKGPYSIVLPICEDCIVVGRHNDVRTARQNAQVKQVKFDAHVARESRRQENDVEEVDASIPTSSSAEPLAPTQPGKHRKRTARASNGATARRRTRLKNQGKRIRK